MIGWYGAFRRVQLGRGVYCYIIQVTKADTLQVVLQYSVHEPTECSWGVRQPEKHAFKMVEAPTGAKCRSLLGPANICQLVVDTVMGKTVIPR